MITAYHFELKCGHADNADENRNCGQQKREVRRRIAASTAVAAPTIFATKIDAMSRTADTYKMSNENKTAVTAIAMTKS